MKLATRINSFLPKFDHDIEAVFEKFNQIGINYVDLNFPEHMSNYSASPMKEILTSHNLKANGVTLRFRSEYINGEFGNIDEEEI